MMTRKRRAQAAPVQEADTSFSQIAGGGAAWFDVADVERVAPVGVASDRGVQPKRKARVVSPPPPPPPPPPVQRTETLSSDDDSDGDLFSERPVLKKHSATQARQPLEVDNNDNNDDDTAVLTFDFQREITPPPTFDGRPPFSAPATLVPLPKPKHVHFAPPPPSSSSAAVHSSVRAIIQEQQVRRSGARSAIDALRANQVPGYDTTAPDAERDVVIDRDAFQSLRVDTAAEYQDANKPPWVQRVNPEQLDRNRRWDLMETLSEIELRNNDWYMCAKRVAGKLQLPIDSMVVLGPSATTAQATQRAASAGAPQISAGSLRDNGATNISDELARNIAATPFRSFGVEGPEIEAGFQAFQMRRERRAAAAGGGSDVAAFPDANDFGIDPRGSFMPAVPDGRRVPDAGAPAAPAGEPMLERQSLGQIEDALLVATQNAVGGDLAQSGARFGSVRAAMPVQTAWYETDPRDEARQRSAVVRADGARARTWSSRAVATGVYYLTDNYCAARNSAYTLITSRADQLSDVPLQFFARPGVSGTVQFRVFEQFTDLIAQVWRMSQNLANRGAKLASDAANIAGGTEAIIRFFVNRITFDDHASEFRDTGVRNSLACRPPGVPRSFATPIMHPPLLVPALRSTLTNPLLIATSPGPQPFFGGTLASHLLMRR